MFFVGIDCATKAKETGLAFGRLGGGKIAVCFAGWGKGEKWESGIDSHVKQWIERGKKEEKKVLLAFDAPLGWPQPFGETLVLHEAGCALPKPADQADRMFYRETDRWIHQHINRNSGNKPLSVGADRIARTAHAALSFLERMRGETGNEIPLAWEPGNIPNVSVIEVYPAATLKGRGFLPATSYRNTAGEENRKNIIENLKMEMTLCPGVETEMEKNDDALDAVVCVLAAADFVRGEAAPPENMELAKKEGWIWVRKVDEQSTLAQNSRRG